MAELIGEVSAGTSSVGRAEVTEPTVEALPDVWYEKKYEENEKQRKHEHELATLQLETEKVIAGGKVKVAEHGAKKAEREAKVKIAEYDANSKK